MEKVLMAFRLTVGEKALLERYCERIGRTQTDVLRELIRSLPIFDEVKG